MDVGTTGSLAGHSRFSIELRFASGLTQSQRHAFEEAAARWSQIVTSDLPSVEVSGHVDGDLLGLVAPGEAVDDLLIVAGLRDLGGPGGLLAWAGPKHVRPGSYLPATGCMHFDVADLAQLEEQGKLGQVVLHEMAHVLGFGTIWTQRGFLVGAGGYNPQFVGPSAMHEYGMLVGQNDPLPVPVANVGGTGTQDLHWRERVFGNELMTGAPNPGHMPLSSLTVASLQDLGYEVEFSAADAYALPLPKGHPVHNAADKAVPRTYRRIGFPTAVVLPQSSVADS